MSKLNEEQKKIFDQCYTTLKTSIKALVSVGNPTDALIITIIIGEAVKTVEATVLRGSDKKSVALELGKILIKDAIEDQVKEAQIILLYDLMAEPLLDKLLDISKHVNVTIPEIPKVEIPKVELPKVELPQVKAPKACCSIM